ncbi:hypothetical protein QYE76_017406 [Lolium multiflorum]|uniref:DUF6598 domain-containing protein n=1 Tax=Lolium multiflorum TaxID=4521 RepID=A0AAD8Q4H4_LOLMU|nr:hypothetical protein QYE76_017406 [Lolium multiflorum]
MGGEEALAAFGARRKKERESEPGESRTDPKAYEARLYRLFWNNNFAAECGSYEDTTLTGPTRAVVVNVHPVYFEVDLKVKGAVESEDRDLSFLALCYTCNGPCISYVTNLVGTSKLSTLKFTFGHILNSVEATVNMEVIRGRWPCDYQGVSTAKTSNIDDMDIVMLAFEDGKLPMDDDCKIKLSRRVICVELVPPDLKKSKLMFTLKALHINDTNGKVEHYLSFKPKKNGRSHRKIKVGPCEIQVTVAWSLLSTFKCFYEEAIS